MPISELNKDNQERLLNRELSWLEFNKRVLAEAMDLSNPLLERLKFTGIVSSNFDEFFMVRISSLEDGSVECRHARAMARELIKMQNSYFLQTLVPELAKAGIVRVERRALNEFQLSYIRNFFQKELFPVLTPIAFSENEKIPTLGNLALYLTVILQKPGISKKDFAVIEIPKNFPRMIALPQSTGFSFVLLEDVVSLFMRELFTGYEIVDQGLMRLTRGAEFNIDEDRDDDFAQVMSEALRARRRGEIIRVEISASETLTQFLKTKLELSDEVIDPVESWFDLKAVSNIAYQPGFDELKRPEWGPRQSIEFSNADDIWELIKQKDVCLQHPYESFDAFLKFINDASTDPDVLAIKQTLYRAGKDSAVMRALERAAENGKQVTALVELKARFDEERNIEWAKRLEIAGANVLYGVRGLKTHAKACLVIRREPEGIKRYAHLSTGNYNEKTARLYSDIGFFTSDEAIAGDLSAFFNMITGFSEPASWAKIDVAPFTLKRKLLRLITRESMRSSAEKPGLIMAKLNSLVDPIVIEALYRASKAGVRIKLNVRGICCLKPGVPGLSDRIEVTSLVDMFLEHSRIFYFQNGGDEEVYLSSADWMPRNLDRRVEVMFPIESKEIKKEMIQLLDIYFRDNVKSWKLGPDGSYQKLESDPKKRFRAQEFLCKRILEREEASLKSPPRELKPQKPKS